MDQVQDVGRNILFRLERNYDGQNSIILSASRSASKYWLYLVIDFLDIKDLAFLVMIKQILVILKDLLKVALCGSQMKLNMLGA